MYINNINKPQLVCLYLARLNKLQSVFELFNLWFFISQTRPCQIQTLKVNSIHAHDSVGKIRKSKIKWLMFYENLNLKRNSIYNSLLDLLIYFILKILFSIFLNLKISNLKVKQSISHSCRNSLGGKAWGLPLE